MAAALLAVLAGAAVAVVARRAVRRANAWIDAALAEIDLDRNPDLRARLLADAAEHHPRSTSPHLSLYLD